MPTPYVMGNEGAGVVEEAGLGVLSLAGERVAWSQTLGSAAGLALIPGVRHGAGALVGVV